MNFFRFVGRIIVAVRILSIYFIESIKALNEEKKMSRKEGFEGIKKH